MKYYKALLSVVLVNLAALCAVTTRLPDRIPIHVNFQGVVDNWSTRWVTPLFGLVPLIILVCFGVYRRRTGERAGVNRRAEDVMISTLTLLFSALSWLTVVMALMNGMHIGRLPMELIAGLPIGLLLLVLGNVMGTVQQPNRWFGIRTKWTLANEEVWRRTHRVSAYSTVSGGLLLVAGCLLSNAFHLPALVVIDLIVAILLAAVVPIFYSWFLYTKLENDKKKHG